MINGGLRAVESAEADQAAAALTGVVVELSARGPTASKHRIVELDLGPVCMRWGRVGAPVSLIGQVQPGVVLFSISAGGSTPWMLNGQPMDQRHMARLAPEASYAMSIEEGTCWIALRLDAAWFQQHHGGKMAPGRSPVEVLACTHGQTRALRSAFSDAWTALHSGQPLHARAFRNCLRERVMASLHAAVANASCTVPRGSPKAFALRHLHRVHRDSALRVDDLCHHLDLGERAVRRLFSEFYGISPAHYLRMRRLHQARRALRSVGTHSVTEIAVGLGFSDLGRFAAHYRSLFGELPSDTLREGRQRFETGFT